MKEAPGSSETSVLTIATRRNIPEDTILHSHPSENLKYYLAPIGSSGIDYLGVRWTERLNAFAAERTINYKARDNLIFYIVSRVQNVYYGALLYLQLFRISLNTWRYDGDPAPISTFLIYCSDPNLTVMPQLRQAEQDGVFPHTAVTMLPYKKQLQNFPGYIKSTDLNVTQRWCLKPE
jgi:hypothetical protein